MIYITLKMLLISFTPLVALLVLAVLQDLVVLGLNLGYLLLLLMVRVAVALGLLDWVQVKRL
jgi:hypothetical protein